MSLEAAVQTRLADWRDKLIDLSRANRLLNHGVRRAGTVRIVEEDPSEVAGLVLAGRTLRFDSKPEEETQPPEEKRRTGDPRLQTQLDAEPLRKVLTRLYRESHASIEEQGFNTLYLALGMLSFTTPEDPAGFRAPLFLLPVEVTRRGARADFRLKAYDDDPIVNPALLLKLRRDHGIEVQLPDEPDGPTYAGVVGAFRPALGGLQNAALEDEIVLGLFSFAKIPLYNDLLEHEATIGAHPIAAALARGLAFAQEGDGALPAPAEVEAKNAGRASSQILDADSSQQAAIVAAREGRSFVLQGPPGTGKSQTIANIIAEALAAERSVLFVSEKMAALEVVQRRLEQAGLGAFCLELHSRKANKREVVRSFERAWAMGSDASEVEQGRLAELTELQGILRAYVEALHAERGAAAFSAFEILGNAARYRTVPEAPFDLDDPLAMDRKTLKQIEQHLRSLTPLYAAVAPTGTYPWRSVRRTELGVSTVEEVRRGLNRFLGALDAATEAAGALRAALGASDPGLASASASEEAAGAVEALLGTTRPPAAWFTDADWGGLSPRARRAVEQGCELEALRERLLARYREDVLEADPAELARRARPGGFVVGWFRRRALRKELQSYLRAAVVDLREDVPALVTARRLRDDVRAADAVLGQAFGDAYAGPTGAFGPLAAHQAYVADLRGRWPASLEITEEVLAAIGGHGHAALHAAAGRWQAMHAALHAAREELARHLVLDEARAWGPSFDASAFVTLKDTAETWLERLNDLPAWLSWQAARGAAAAAGLGGYLDAFEGRSLDPRHLLDGWFRTWWETAADQLLAEVDELKAFDGRAHDGRVDRYRVLDRQEIEAARRRVTARLQAAVPHPNVRSVGDSEVGVLKREIGKQRRHLPVRVLLDRIPQLQRLLKPCLMMSPLSVATYLPPDRERFDLVVFDEASQICTEDGVGAIARGRQVVVCGDSKQLPPTRFFERRVDDDEAPEDAIVDLPSILDECKAGPLPQIPLMWHYRSRDESLITFSNHHFYEDSLVTFPNAARDAPDLGISFVHVEDGVYHPGAKGSRSNPIEAARVAERMFEILRDRPEDTIGVVTFSTTQRDEVLDAIDARRRAGDTYAERFDGDAIEPVFVKNLEAVQGDERDVILFSVGYGPDPEGVLRLNFGPLNKEGGDRRLNVAVTRARKQVIVHASLLPEDIDTTRAKGRGAALLRAYMEVARRGMQGTAPVADGQPLHLTPLVTSLQRALEARGFQVDPKLGNSAFKVDLAVRDPDHAGRYVLAILCDGPAYARAATTRDRERTRCEVLERLGWHVHRVWTPDWVRAPGRELDRIASAVETAREAIANGETVGPPAIPAAPSVGAPAALDLDAEPELPGVVDYRAANLRLRGPAAEFHVVPIGRIASALQRVIDVEGPLHVDLAVRRLGVAWGIARTTSKVTERFEAALAALVRDGTVAREGSFVRSPSSTQIAVRRPADGVQRAIEEIPPEELAACVGLVVDAYLGIARDSLVKEVSRAFGFQRLGERIQSTLDPVVAGLLAEGVLLEADGRLRRPPAESDGAPADDATPSSA